MNLFQIIKKNNKPSTQNCKPVVMLHELEYCNIVSKTGDTIVELLRFSSKTLLTETHENGILFDPRKS